MKWLFPAPQPPGVPLAGRCPCLQLPRFNHTKGSHPLVGVSMCQHRSQPGSRSHQTLGWMLDLLLSVPHSSASPAEKGMQVSEKKNEKLFSPVSSTEAFL